MGRSGEFRITGLSLQEGIPSPTHSSPFPHPLPEPRSSSVSKKPRLEYSQSWALHSTWYPISYNTTKNTAKSCSTYKQLSFLCRDPFKSCFEIRNTKLPSSKKGFSIGLLSWFVSVLTYACLYVILYMLMIVLCLWVPVYLYVCVFVGGL